MIQHKNTPRLERRSLSYGLFLFWGYFYYRIFYRRYKVVGRNTIPKGVPVIFAANHQNALMDDIALLFGTRKQVAIMARADLFKNRILARIFNWFKMIPVYRPRDGMENMDRNELSFERAASVLMKKRYVTIFPEGNHASSKRLRLLKKGICRIAFLAEEKSGFGLGLKIMPVGLDFSNYFRAGTELLVLFGEPLLVKDYEEIYLENPVLAINRLKEDLSARLKKVMIHYESEKYCELLNTVTEMYSRKLLKNRGLKKSLLNRFRVRQEIAERINKAMESGESQAEVLESLVKPYSKALNIAGIRDWVVERNHTNLLMLVGEVIPQIILLPIHLYGMILNYLPYKIPELVSGKLKDRIFRNSMNFGVSLFLYPLYYLLMLLVIWLLGLKGLLLPAFLISMPVTGLIAFYNFRHLKRLRGKFRLATLRLRNRHAYDYLIVQRKAIIQYFESFTGI